MILGALRLAANPDEDAADDSEHSERAHYAETYRINNGFQFLFDVGFRFHVCFGFVSPRTLVVDPPSVHILRLRILSDSFLVYHHCVQCQIQTTKMGRLSNQAYRRHM